MTDPIKLSQTTIMWEIPPGVRRLSQAIEIINQNADQYLFKIKGTTRNRFIVQPAHGLIKAFQKIKITFVVDLPPGTDTSKSIVDKFMLYTLVAPPDAENKEGLDDYIKENAKLCHETKIQSTINFIRPAELDGDIMSEMRTSSGAPNYLEGSHAGDKIFQSLIDQKPLIRQEETVDPPKFKADEEIFESKIHTKPIADSAKTATPDKSLIQTQTPAQPLTTTQIQAQAQTPAQNLTQTQTPGQPSLDNLTVTQIDRLTPKDDPEIVKKLKETIFRLKADLKSATVR